MCDCNDQRDILEVLKFELEFLEQGGYGRPVRTPWKPTSVFQDSPSCINFNSREQTHACNECLLNELVPENSQSEKVPCHHIALNSDGETVHSMERQRTQGELESALRDWLRVNIARIERDRNQASPTPSS